MNEGKLTTYVWDVSSNWPWLAKIKCGSRRYIEIGHTEEEAIAAVKKKARAGEEVWSLGRTNEVVRF